MVEAQTAQGGPKPRLTTAVSAILRTDGLRIVRDRFLIGMLVYIVAIAIAMRWLIPFVTEQLSGRVHFDLAPYHPLIVSHVLLQLTPLIGAVVGGFLLLETKETGVIRALRTTPVPITRHIVVLGSVLLVATTLVVVIEGVLIGIALPPLGALVLSSLVAAPAAVALALFIPTVASTKTEAFAYTKLVSILPLIPSGSWFVPEPWQYIAGAYPPYWASKAYWLAVDGSDGWLMPILVGAVISCAWIVIMQKLFIQRMRQ